MKRFFPIFLTLALILTLAIAGCGGGNNGGGNPGGPSYNPGQSVAYTVRSTPSFSFNMNYVLGGLTFPTDNDDKTIPPSTVANAYWIAETDVTYQLWSVIYTWAKLTNYNFANDGVKGGGNKDIDGGNSAGTTQQPVTKVSWRDAMVWCNALTEYFNATNPGTTLACVYRYNGAIVKDATDATACDNVTAVSTAKGFRLPTSNEWELAARYKDGKNWTPGNYASGATADYNNAIATADVAVYGTNNTEIVKSKKHNALGLYDMSGNVNQFCFDLYPGSGQSRVLRGGCWGYIANNVQIGFMYSNNPNATYEGNGFRLARTQ